ncbi:MAG TPA: PEP-CTERM sorting domain-containing protein [Vicinamibacterales bacterium]|nr:PEP-CTERM sorting domain-containing protein [Vicinamibacterales bacterium]
MRAPRRLLPLLLSCPLYLAGPPDAAADPLYLNIRPIQVCDDLGLACANPGRLLFEDITRAIWEQADIWLNVLAWERLDAASLLATTFDRIVTEGQPPAIGPSVINVWFVNQIVACSSEIFTYGCGRQGGGGLAISDSVFQVGRTDTLAHELGHNLGLAHVLDPLNVMAYGDIRLVPLLVSQVYPIGSLGRLTANQVVLARASEFVTTHPVPEPASILLVLGGGALVGFSVRRRRSH